MINLILDECVFQGVEGVRGRQGLEGPKGDDVSSTAQRITDYNLML